MISFPTESQGGVSENVFNMNKNGEMKLALERSGGNVPDSQKKSKGSRNRSKCDILTDQI